MSKVTTTGNGRMQINQYDTSKIFIFSNSFIDGVAINPDYETVEIPGGTVMGRIGSTQELVPMKSTATDGSQYPVGILNQNYPVESGNSAEVSICVKGEVDKSLVILAAGDTFETLIGGRSIQDRISSDTVGIKLVDVEELSQEDND